MSERPMPSSIAISTLIALYIDPSSPLEHEGNMEQLLDTLMALVQGPYQPLPVVLKRLSHNQHVSEVLIETLSAAASEVDSLVDLMLSIQAVDADGELGIFVRKVSLGFDKLSFESTTRLWEALKQELESFQNQDSEQWEEGEAVTSAATQWSLSSQQKQDLIILQCLTLDENVTSMPPEELAPQVQDILEQEDEIPAAHFLKFLINLQRGSKVGALDALHQYFDYAMIAERKNGLQRQVILHYATLLLATVYHKCGNEELSEKATAEAIHVAQQSGDPACVAHALSLLYQSTGNRDILEKCAVRALQAKLRRLMAGAHCALAQTASTHQEAWELLLDATTDKPSLTVDRPTHMQDLSSPEEAMEIMGQISLTSADIWETMGFQGMSALITEIALECFGDRITSEVKAMAVQNLARKLLSGPLLVDNEQGLSRYGLALQTVKEQGNAFGTCLLLQEWAVRRGEYGHAKALLDYLHSRLHPGMPNYKLAKLQVGTQEAMFLSRQGWIKEAKAKLHGLIKKCQEEKWISQQANLLIQLAVTQLDANRHEFRGVIQPTRDCLKLTRDHSMDVLYATAQSIMAQIHYRMSSTNRAIAMLKGCMPTLHQNGHVWFVGEAYLTLAKCYLKNESLELALGSLNKSGDFFTQCQDFVRLREVYYLKANIYNTMDDIDQREEMSARFVDISRQLAKGTVPSGLGQIEDHDFLDHMTKRQVHATAR